MADKVIETVEVDGISIDVNVSYFTSWKGVKQASEVMSVANDSNANDMQRVGVMLPYFEGAVANFDDVLEALGGDDASILDVITTVQTAISKVGELKNR